MTIPRRVERFATLIVEVSSDLTTWNSGASFTTMVSNSTQALVVRDLTAASPGMPRRFMRLRVSLP